MEPQKRSWLPHKVCFQILLKSLQTNIQVPHIRWKSVPKTRPRYRETSIAVALESPGRTDEISSSSWTKVLTTGRWSHVAAWFSKICRSCTDQAAPDEKTDLELNALGNREPMQVITQGGGRCGRIFECSIPALPTNSERIAACRSGNRWCRTVHRYRNRFATKWTRARECSTLDWWGSAMTERMRRRWKKHVWHSLMTCSSIVSSESRITPRFTDRRCFDQRGR